MGKQNVVEGHMLDACVKTKMSLDREWILLIEDS